MNLVIWAGINGNEFWFFFKVRALSFFFQICSWVSWWHIMQRWHIKNNRISNIIYNWCYMMWLSSEIVFLPMPVPQLQVIINVTCPNFSYWHLWCQWNDVWSIISWNFNYVRCSSGTENHFNWIQGGKWPSKKGRPYSVVVLIVSMSNYTDLTPYDNR